MCWLVDSQFAQHYGDAALSFISLRQELPKLCAHALHVVRPFFADDRRQHEPELRRHRLQRLCDPTASRCMTITVFASWRTKNVEERATVDHDDRASASRQFECQ